MKLMGRFVYVAKIVFIACTVIYVALCELVDLYFMVGLLLIYNIHLVCIYARAINWFSFLYW